jgi:hypothetical protein
VRIKARRAGSGTIAIDYGSLEELDGLIARLKRA